jgi:hypothetical protein
MNAHKGDWLIIDGQHASRRGRILEVHGKGGTPPFLVRWTDTDHDALVMPGPDARVVSGAELADFARLERERLDRLQASIAHR